jgi:hypothetical protein
MPRMKISADDMDLLTEEERVGLKEHLAELDAEMDAEDAEIAAAATGEPEAAAAPAKPPKKSEAKPEPKSEPEPVSETPPAEDEEEEEEEPEAEDEPATEDEPAEDQPGEGDEGATEDEEDEDEPAPSPPPAAAPVVTPALNLTLAEEERLKAIPKQLREIAQRFDEGELTAVEMRDQQEVLQDELDALKEKRVLAKVSNQQVEDTWFKGTIPLFMAQHPEYVAGSARHKLLNTLVIELQRASDNPTDPAILYKAHKQIIDEIGEAKATLKPKPKAKKNGNGREMPPNFSAIPASDQTPATVPNKFARLDKLKGADYEKALAKLSPADRDFYLQGG